MALSKSARIAKMLKAKEALKILAQYAKNTNEPYDLEQLLSMLSKHINKVAGENSNDTLKSVTAFCLLLSDLNRKAIKVRYAKPKPTATQERDKMILEMRSKGISYQKIADRLALRGKAISAVAIFKIVKKYEAVKNG